MNVIQRASNNTLDYKLSLHRYEACAELKRQTWTKRHEIVHAENTATRDNIESSKSSNGTKVPRVERHWSIEYRAVRL